MSKVGIAEVQPQDLTLEGVAERMSKHQARIDELVRRYPVKRATLLQVLWLIQEEFGWVPRLGIKWAAGIAEVSPVHAFAVTEFYTMYKQVPPARWHIRVCQTVNCLIQGSEALIAHLEEKLGIACGSVTEDNLFALERVECLAACGNGPAVQIDDEFLYGPEELNQHEDGWHTQAADVDRWIERLRAEAAAHPEWETVDQLGGIILDSLGHPGAPKASGSPNQETYAAAPPAINLNAEGANGKITVHALIAPECSKLVFERSDDDLGFSEVGAIDPSTIKGPPGPKTVTFDDRVDIGKTVYYRAIAHSGNRVATPSSSIAITTEARPEADTEYNLKVLSDEKSGKENGGKKEVNADIAQASEKTANKEEGKK